MLHLLKNPYQKYLIDIDNQIDFVNNFFIRLIFENFVFILLNVDFLIYRTTRIGIINYILKNLQPLLARNNMSQLQESEYVSFALNVNFFQKHINNKDFLNKCNEKKKKKRLEDFEAQKVVKAVSDAL
ncbi:hypothetical protein H8356DRAFT_1417891 [Neocallimastix lanati (nom. inval.)]|nr:hypothetical protein H8356DRAFT_1417891 [Neocallimastix sp. JGI-2020a]